MSSLRIRLPFALVVTATIASAPFVRADNSILLPIPAEVRTILDNRCVMCHGEVIEGEAEIREDLIMTTDQEFVDTLSDVQTLYEMIRDDEMPQEARLSFRLRRNAEMRERLAKLQEDYVAKGEKEALIKWLEAALAKAKPE